MRNILILLLLMSFSSYGQVIEKTVKATKYMATDTIKSMSGNGINVFGNQLKWLADPTASQDGVNLRFLSSYMLRSDSLTKFITPTQLNDSLVSINDALNDTLVHIQRTQTITGAKTFSSNVAVNAQGVGIGVNAETTVDNGYDIGLSALAWKDPILAANKTTSITNAYINGMTMRVNSANIVSPTAGIGVGTIYRLPILGWSDPAISDKDAAKVGAYWTDITQGSEDAKYSIKLTYNGVVDTERFAVHSTGDIETPRGAYHYYRQTLGTNTLGDWRTYADANNFYTEYYDGSTWVMKGQIQK